MEIVKNTKFPRNSDGAMICACGCRKTFKFGDGVLWSNFNTSNAPNEVYSNSAAYSIYRAECLEIVGKGKTINSLESRQLDLLELSRSNPAELQKLYNFMHDGLGCRI